MIAEKTPMKKVMGVTEARNQFSQLLNRVHRGEELLVVEKLGIEVAAIIGINEYREFEKFLAERRLKNTQSI
jgi:prevent-host-death family protein